MDDAERIRRGRLLFLALGFRGLDVKPEAMPFGARGLHAWLDSWHGIGVIERGLARQDRDLWLTRYGRFCSEGYPGICALWLKASPASRAMQSRDRSTWRTASSTLPLSRGDCALDSISW